MNCFPLLFRCLALFFIALTCRLLLSCSLSFFTHLSFVTLVVCYSCRLLLLSFVTDLSFVTLAHVRPLRVVCDSLFYLSLSLVVCFSRSCSTLIIIVLEQLTPDKADIYVAAPQFQSIADKREPVYGTPYTLKMVDAATTRTWAGG